MVVPKATVVSDTEMDGHRRFLRAANIFLRSRLLRWGFLAVAVGLCLYTVARQWQQVRGALADLGAPVLLASFAGVALAMLASAETWRVLLGALGSPLSRTAAASIMFVGQLGKYLPGSVWPVLAQMELGRAHDVPRSRSATAAVLTMLVSLCGGLLVAAVALPFTAPSPGYRWFLLAAPVLLAVLHPRLLNPLLRLASRGRLAVERIALGPLTAALGWSLLSWLCYGVPIWLLATRLGAPPGPTVLIAVGGFAFAWSVGFLVVIAPAGAGVRDVLLVTAVATVLPVADATAVALVSRLLMTIGDVLAAGIAATIGRRRD
jgi:uncharacterized membrane protein YbhN (UPF0104 family)